MDEGWDRESTEYLSLEVLYESLSLDQSPSSAIDPVCSAFSYWYSRSSSSVALAGSCEHDPLVSFGFLDRTPACLVTVSEFLRCSLSLLLYAPPQAVCLATPVYMSACIPEYEDGSFLPSEYAVHKELPTFLSKFSPLICFPRDPTCKFPDPAKICLSEVQGQCSSSTISWLFHASVLATSVSSTRGKSQPAHFGCSSHLSQ